MNSALRIWLMRFGFVESWSRIGATILSENSNFLWWRFVNTGDDLSSASENSVPSIQYCSGIREWGRINVPGSFHEYCNLKACIIVYIIRFTDKPFFKAHSRTSYFFQKIATLNSTFEINIFSSCCQMGLIGRFVCNKFSVFYDNIVKALPCTNYCEYCNVASRSRSRTGF